MYYLKLYDEELAKFNIHYDCEGFRVTDFHILEDKQSLLPKSLVPTEEGMKDWLRKRSIPKNREFVDGFLSKLGLNNNNIKGIVDISKALSLNDSYWVSDDSFKKTYEECNLYEHRFNNILGQIAFTGYGSSVKSDFVSSPELTTNGQLAKCWRRINGKIYLYKAGTSGFVSTGKEPYSEYYAAQIAKAMDLDFVDYNLSKWKGRICSVCELFTDIDHSYIPMGYIIKTGGFSKVLEYLITLDDSFKEAFIDMIVFDTIIMNTDRHYGNFGVIVENKTNKIIKLAPIFDNGASLCCYAMDNDEFTSLDTLRAYSKTRQAIMYSDAFEICRKYMTSSQKAKLRKLIGFKFKKHPRYNLPQKRLKLLEELIQERVRLLLQ